MQLLSDNQLNTQELEENKLLFFSLPAKSIADKPICIPNDANLVFSLEKNLQINNAYLIYQNDVLKIAKVYKSSKIPMDILGKLTSIEALVNFTR